MAAPIKTYAEWLEERLISVNPEIDTDVFVSYLIGILEEEDLSSEEKKESISGFLGEIAESDREVLCTDIINQWEVYNKPPDISEKGANAIVENLSSIFVKQTLEVATVPTKELTEEQKAQKEAILAQFRNMDNDEVSTQDDPGAMGASSHDDFLSKNTNKDTVVKMQKEMREKSKQESAAKKEKNKQDKEKQKQKQQDRKDSEKKRTQKGERKR